MSTATELFDRAVKPEMAQARADGALEAVQSELSVLRLRLKVVEGERDYYKGELGDLRDLVDELTKFRGANLAVALSDLVNDVRERCESDADRYELTAREVR